MDQCNDLWCVMMEALGWAGFAGFILLCIHGLAMALRAMDDDE